MRKILFLLLLISGVSKAQWTPQTAWGYQFKRVKVDSSLIITGDTIRNKAGIAQIGSNLFLYNGYWRVVGGGGGTTTDTTSLSNRINAKVSIADSTNGYVTPTTLIDSIGSITANYQQFVYDEVNQNNLAYIDPILATKINIADSGWRYVTPSTLGNYLQSGTDISVKSVNVTGTNGSGHINLRHQATDPTSGGQQSTLFAASNGRLKYKNDGNAVSDIATIDDLTGFATTSSVNTALGLKVNISDTAAMLNGRLSSITLNTTGAIHNSPITFSRLGGAWSGTMSLANQSANTIFRRGSGTGTPSFGSIDSSYFGGNFANQVLQRGTLAQRIVLIPSVGQQFYQTDIFSGLYEYNGRVWVRNRTGVINDCDFLNFNDLGMNGFAISQSGTGAGYNFGATNGTAQNTTGVVALGTGTTTTGYARCMYASLNTGGNASYPINSASTYIYNIRVLFPTLADATNSFNARFGSDNNVNGNTNTNGLNFLYSNANANWQLQYTNTSSSFTTTNSGIAVVANTWYDLSIVFYGSTVEYYINNSLVAKVTLGGDSIGVTPLFGGIYKTAGTTSRSVWIDFMKFYQLK